MGYTELASVSSGLEPDMLAATPIPLKVKGQNRTDTYWVATSHLTI